MKWPEVFAVLYMLKLNVFAIQLYMLKVDTVTCWYNIHPFPYIIPVQLVMLRIVLQKVCTSTIYLYLEQVLFIKFFSFH